MKQKILIGVEHAKEEELKVVVKEIKFYSPSSLGLELSEDYLEKERYGISFFFFSDLASEFKNTAKIIPLEQSGLYDYCLALGIAKSVREGKLEEERVMAEFKSGEAAINPYVPPEMAAGVLHFITKYKKAIEILDGNKTLEEVLELWRASNEEREKYMLENIRRHRPDTVVMGDAHALKLKGRLPKYKYKAFY